jgi:hypothetical protein
MTSIIRFNLKTINYYMILTKPMENHQPHEQEDEETLFAGCSKTLRYKAPKTPRSESYIPVRRNDEG